MIDWLVGGLLILNHFWSGDRGRGLRAALRGLVNQSCFWRGLGLEMLGWKVVLLFKKSLCLLLLRLLSRLREMLLILRSTDTMRVSNRRI